MSKDPLSHYLRPASHSSMVWWLIPIFLCMLSTWGLFVLHRQHLLIEQEKTVLFSMQKASRVVAKTSPTRIEREAQSQWAALRRELNYSWYPVFSGLEHTSNQGVALLEFVLDKASAGLTLHGTARDIEALADYLTALQGEPVFKDVYLSHQKKVQQGPTSIFEFEIRLKIKDMKLEPDLSLRVTKTNAS